MMQTSYRSSDRKGVGGANDGRDSMRERDDDHTDDNDKIDCNHLRADIIGIGRKEALGLDEQQRQASRSSLRILDFYLTFIHYFGFSINPNDSANPRYLSMRVRRALASSMRHRQHARASTRWQSRATSSTTSADIELISIGSTGSDGESDGSDVDLGIVAVEGMVDPGDTGVSGANEGEQQFGDGVRHGGRGSAACVRDGDWASATERLGDATLRAPPVPAHHDHNSLVHPQLVSNCSKRLKLAIKLSAIGLTSFLTLNHVLVLIDYVRQSSKAFPEFLLELRLVLTKLSALIFLICWHRNQSEVRQLIRLVKSTSINILVREGHTRTQLSMPSVGGGRAGATRPVEPRQVERFSSNAVGEGREQQGQGELASLRRLDGRILAWWLLCTSIIVVHFSLSEAEIKSARHLWEWLDDYSLHTLSNATTSTTSLFLMASFDNYIYTVHVYGTRLIGSSVICIVCTFQLENINCLTRRALGLMQPIAGVHGGGIDASVPGATTGARKVATLLGHHFAPTRDTYGGWLRWPTILGSFEDGPLRCRAPGASARAVRPCCIRGLDLAQQRQLAGTFYVLGDSNWLQVERERRKLACQGWLSASLGEFWRALTRALGCTGAQASCALRALNRVTPCARWPAAARDKFSLARAVHENSQSVRASGASQRDGDDFERAATTTALRNGNIGDPPASTEAAAHCSQQRPRQCATNNASVRADRRASSDLCTLVSNSRGSSRALHNYHNHHARADQRGSLLRNYLNDYLAREQRRRRAALARVRARDNNVVTNPDDAGETTRRRAKLRGAREGSPFARESTGGNGIELRLDELARKYELIRTVNLRIDRCFGHILLGQYLFLFLMSCIDVVFFSLSFSTNTKTKYIIVSGTILLWLPYLLLYRYASDIGLASERLLTSVRRLARLSLVLELSAEAAAAGCSPAGEAQTEDQLPPASAPLCDALARRDRESNRQLEQRGSCAAATCRLSPPVGTRQERALFWHHSTLWHHRYLFSRRLAAPSGRHVAQDQRSGVAAENDKVERARQRRPPTSSGDQQALGDYDNARVAAAGANLHASPLAPPPPPPLATSRARIFNKLDHVFKPTNLTIVGIMTMNKFFLLNFAKIVITASVMTIQFITKR